MKYKKDWFELSWEDANVITEGLSQTKNALKDMLESLIPTDFLAEDFVNSQTLETHFKKHCLAGENKVSKKTNVYYDFNILEAYKDYENKLSEVFNNEDIIIINSLYDTETIKNAFNKLLAGNSYVLFSADCRLLNNLGVMLLGLHSFADNATTNYQGHTIDFSVLVPNKTTDTLESISLFPLDISQVEHTFNNFVEQHCEYKNTNAVNLKALNLEDK